MKIQIQLDSQCEEPEILIRTAAVTAEIRELVEKLSEKRSDSVVGYDADSAVLLEKSQIIRIYGASQKVYAQTPQGKFCLRQRLYELEQLLTQKAPLLVILEDLQDPGNLGTILRAAEGAGVDGVIMTKDTVDILNPKVIRATMGSIYRMPFYQTTDLKDTIYTLKNKGIQVYAAHLEDSVCYDEADYRVGTAFLIGNEGNGLKRETADAATRYIKIPMLGQVESLNAAMATSILMYEAARQRRERHGY